MTETSNTSGEHTLSVPLIALLALVAANLLFPDTYTDLGFYLGPVKITMTVIWLVLASPIIVYKVVRDFRDLDPGLIDVVFLATVVYLLTRGLIASNVSSAPVNNTRIILAYCAYALILYYGAALLIRGKGILLSCRVLVGLATFIAAYAIVELITQRNFLYERLLEFYLLEAGYIATFGEDFVFQVYRSNSTIGHPIALGLVLLQLLPFAVYLFFRSRRWISRFILVIAIIINLVALTAVFSKSVFVTTLLLAAAGFILFYYLYRQKRRIIIVTAFLLVLGVSSIIMLRHDAFRAYFSSTLWESSISGRIDPLDELVSQDTSDLVFGHGLYQNGAEGIWYDSIYSSTLYEEGIIGLLLTGAFLLLILRQIILLLKGSLDRRPLTLAIAFSIAAMTINGFANSTFLTWPNMIIFFFIAGMLRSLERSDDVVCECDKRNNQAEHTQIA